MPEDNLILQNWRQQKKIFTDNLLISRKRPTKGSVHDLRVAVKKIRSYLRLKKKISGEDWKELFSTILALFKSFGKLGDFDMSLTLLRRHERKEQLSFDNFREYLNVNRALTRKWVKQDAIRFNIQELDILDQQFNLDLTDKEIVEKIIQYSIARLKKVEILSRHFQKNAHKIRKQLKDVYHWIKICPKNFTENFVRIKSFDQMLKNLGSWQDHYVLRQKINQYAKDIAKNEEKGILKTLDNKLAGVQDDLLKKAKTKWKAVIVQKAYKKAAI
jgi:CHAD domain-containing protein